MKNLILILIVPVFLISCSDKNNNDYEESTITWKDVFFDGMSNADVHDPKYNYTLIIDPLNNVEIITPTEGLEEKIIAIEILKEFEMDVTWDVNNETRIVRTGYSYNNQNELIIDKFTYTLAQVPFPNNLTSAKFIKQTYTNNQ